MTPELRKEMSELLLHKRGIRVNVQLHVIEADEEVKLRSALELEQRLLALWGVEVLNQAASSGQATFFSRQTQLANLGLRAYWSAQEKDFVQQLEQEVQLNQVAPTSDFARANLHALHFLSWCAGLLANIDLHQHPKRYAEATQSLWNQFPSLSQDSPQPGLLGLQLRRKALIMDWADLLYRLHWAVRHAALTGKAPPGKIDSVMVQAWHKAVNWMCCYDEEHDWDRVSTETTA